MAHSPIASLAVPFSILSAPRAQHSLEHKLIAMVVITIWAMICGAESWVAIEHDGHAKQQWFGKFLALPSGIPSTETRRY